MDDIHNTQKDPDVFISPTLEPGPALPKVGDRTPRIVHDEEAQNLRKGLQARHTQMIAIAGAIVRQFPSLPFEMFIFVRRTE